MALQNYGVLIGYWVGGGEQWSPYLHLQVVANRRTYSCSIVLESSPGADIEWRVVPLAKEELEQVAALGNGFHLLESTSTSGALDYIRSPMLKVRMGCLAYIDRLLGREFDVASAWNRGTSQQAHADLLPLLERARSINSARVIMFGKDGTIPNSIRRMHKIRQNQGSPEGSESWPENGVWQDGCCIFEQEDGSYVAFLIKLITQAYRTDEQGHPLP